MISLLRVYSGLRDNETSCQERLQPYRGFYLEDAWSTSVLLWYLGYVL